MKSGSPNLLEPSGPVKACNGIALPLPSNKLRNKHNQLDTHFTLTITLLRFKVSTCFGHYLPIIRRHYTNAALVTVVGMGWSQDLGRLRPETSDSEVCIKLVVFIT
jgi:hypothetical protein